MVTVPVASQFLGIVDVYLATYTTTYAPLSGGTWDFNGNSLVPMEFEGWVDAVTTACRGFKARLIELPTGYTDITVGNPTGIIHSDQFGPACYDLDNQKICGFGVGAPVNTNFPTVWEYSLQYGAAAQTIPNFSPAATNIPFLANNNTGLPNPGCGINWLTVGNGVYASSEDGLTPSSQVWGRGGGFGGGIASKLFSLNGLNFPTNARMGGLIPWRGGNWILASNGTGGNNPYNVSNTNFVNNTVNYLVTNPTQPASSTVNFTTFLIDSANQNYTANFNYWLQTFPTTETFNGQTLTGWGLRVAPDFSTYEILKFIPLDANAAAWYIQPGRGLAALKIDRRGNIWMKTANIQGSLLVASVAANRFVPQGPTVPIEVNRGLYR